MALQANCPSCGAQVLFRTGSSVVVVCEFCRSVVARTDRGIEDAGKVADVVESGSPLEVGLGGVYAGLAIYDTLTFVKPDVRTICVGTAMSMGAVLLAAGTKGKRSALPNAKILIHQAWSPGFGGQASDVEIRAREIIALKSRLEQILADHTGQPLDRIKQDTDRDRFMSSQEAVEYGLIDEVIEHR